MEEEDGEEEEEEEEEEGVSVLIKKAGSKEESGIDTHTHIRIFFIALMGRIDSLKALQHHHHHHQSKGSQRVKSAINRQVGSKLLSTNRVQLRTKLTKHLSLLSNSRACKQVLVAAAAVVDNHRNFFGYHSSLNVYQLKLDSKNKSKFRT